MTKSTQSIRFLKSTGLLVSLLFLLFYSGLSQANTAGNWRFQVTLDGKPIGQHSFTIRGNQQQSTVISQATFKVKFLGFTAYTYQHKNTERWQGSCLSSMQASTNDNGDLLSVTGQKKQGAFNITTQSGTKANRGCVRSFAYWNLPYMKSPQLLNPQTGELLKVRLQDMGNDTLMANGKQQAARRYRLSGKDLQIDLWYSAKNRWLGLESLAENGKRIRYVLQ